MHGHYCQWQIPTITCVLIASFSFLSLYLLKSSVANSDLWASQAPTSPLDLLKWNYHDYHDHDFNHDLTNSCILIMIMILSSPHHQFRGRNSNCRPTLDSFKWNHHDYHDFDHAMIKSHDHGHDLIISSSRAARTADLPLTCWSGILGIANSGSPTFLRQCY